MGKTLVLSALLFVHIWGDGNSPAWKARALEGTVSQYLTRFEKLQLADDLQVSDFNCEDQDSNCLIQNAKNKNVSVLILGQIKNNTLNLDAYETETKRKISTTNILLSQTTDLNDFKHHIFKLIKPFIDLGGVIDQNKLKQESSSLIFQILALIFGVAVALALILSPRFLQPHLKRHFQKLKNLPFKLILVCLAVLIILALILQSVRYHPIYEARMEKMRLKAEELKNGK